jgi:hypothetical protein
MRQAGEGDAFLQRADVASQHSVSVSASPACVYRAVLELDLRTSRTIRHLLRFRGMPAWVGTLEGLQRLGFILLTTEENREIVLGVAGRFWTLRGDLQRLTPDAFRTFARDGFAKATWSFSIEPGHGGMTELRTATKIQCFGPAARRRFKIYWLFVGPVSGWVRREVLRTIKRQAENAATDAAT